MTNKNYFVIGLSGITNGGKTTLSHLLQRSFPWCRVIYQDAYFYPDDSPHHVRIPHLDNHVNYEVIGALDMKRMEEDVLRVLEKPNFFGGKGDNNSLEEEKTNAPNFETSGKELLNTVSDIGFDTSKYRNVPILLLEGFLLFESQVIYDICDIRFFLTLTKEECQERRSQRTTYNPPDCEGYFEDCIWPEYLKHYNKFIASRQAEGSIHIFRGAGDMKIETIWRESLTRISKEIERTFPRLLINESN